MKIIQTMKTAANSARVIHVTPKMAQDEVDRIRGTHPYKNSVMFRSFRTLLYSMKVMGLYFDREPTDKELLELQLDDAYVPKKKRRVTAAQVYSSITLTIIWINWIRMFTAFSGADTMGLVLFFKFLIVVWIGLCAIQHTTMFRGSISYTSGLSGMFVKWVNIQKEFVGGEPSTVPYILYRVYIHTGLAWFVAIVQFWVVAYGCYGWGIMPIIATPIPPDHPYINCFAIIFLFIHFYVSCAWTLPIAFQFMACVMLFKEYQKMSSSLSRAINKNGKLDGNLEFYRKWHHHVCQLTDHVDGILSVMTASILSSCIVFICLILYALIWFRNESENELSMVTVYSFWLIMAVIKMCIAAVGGAIVNDAAHAPFAIVHGLDMTDVQTETTVQISVFLNRLSGSSIGMTASRLFVIDKPSVLTIFGMLITYFVVMVQFTPLGDQKTNCTELIANSTLYCQSAL